MDQVAPKEIKMKTYRVCTSESVVYTRLVEAKNEQEAIQKVDISGAPEGNSEWEEWDRSFDDIWVEGTVD